MSASISVIGKKYNRLTVIGEYSNGRRVIRHCLCDCGNKTDVVLDKLVSGHTKSCGCLNHEKRKTTPLKHGESKTRLWRIYAKMLRRCYVPKEPAYKYYGALGVRICDEWLNDRSKFFDWAKKNGYQDDLTIDRINVYGDYSPDNCRWATAQEQTRNKRNNRYFNCFGKEQVLSDWAREYDINIATLRHRLEKGWSMEKSLTTPIQTNRRNLNAKRLSKGVI